MRTTPSVSEYPDRLTGLTSDEGLRGRGRFPVQLISQTQVDVISAYLCQFICEVVLVDGPETILFPTQLADFGLWKPLKIKDIELKFHKKLTERSGMDFEGCEREPGFDPMVHNQPPKNS
jgi:hypothetical protein